MSSNTWLSFFKEAGIPSSSADNYAALFEDNRITREMLLDLNKEILQDIGINVIGDIIAILKYAKKVHQKELKAKDSTKKTSVAVAPINLAPPISTDVKDDNKDVEDDDDVQYTTVSYQKKLAEEEEEQNMLQVGKLHSERLKFKKLEPIVHEEYTTSTYEARLNLKRSAPQLSDNVSTNKVTKIVKAAPAPTRVVILPSITSPATVTDTKPSSNQAANRSRRFLEAAGCFRSANDEVTKKVSVFSRLELPPERLSGMQDVAPSSNIKSRLGIRKATSPPPQSSLPAKKFGKLHSDFETTDVHSRLGPKKLEEYNVDDDDDDNVSSGFKPTMIADTISKHSDVHARLKKKGVALESPARGPLGKRLGDHAVFNRLE